VRDYPTLWQSFNNKEEAQKTVGKKNVVSDEGMNSALLPRRKSAQE
jgi:hypothetical protein